MNAWSLPSPPVGAWQMFLPLEQDRVHLLEACGGNRSAAEVAALSDWCHRHGQRQRAEADIALADDVGSAVACDPIEAAREAAALVVVSG